MRLTYWLIGIFALHTIWLLYVLHVADSPFDVQASKGVWHTGWRWAFAERTWWYEWLNLATLFFPLLLSFDRKVRFYKQWGALFPAIVLTGALFLAWDVYFTQQGVWGFNERYIGVRLLGLPLGEWLFFVTVPYACLFIYECLNAYFPRLGFWQHLPRYLSPSLVVMFAVLGLTNGYGAYTAWTFPLAAALLALQHWAYPGTRRLMSYFYRAFALCLLPFILVNGILTGSVNEEPVVLYNNAHNLSALGLGRFGTIPWDDFGYCFLLLFINVVLFEHVKQWSARKSITV